MREIKFRGKDLINGCWVYGNLEVPSSSQNTDKYYITGFSDGLLQKREVDPKSVGQYTGFTDYQDDKECYEGDIVEDHFGEKHLIVWDKFMFNFKDYHNAYLDYPTIAFSEGGVDKVLGNMFDNPELLSK